MNILIPHAAAKAAKAAKATHHRLKKVRIVFGHSWLQETSSERKSLASIRQPTSGVAKLLPHVTTGNVTKNALKREHSPHNEPDVPDACNLA